MSVGGTEVVEGVEEEVGGSRDDVRMDWLNNPDEEEEGKEDPNVLLVGRLRPLKRLFMVPT